jgi:type IV pilus biogenesis protein CpaD/CtpE
MNGALRRTRMKVSLALAGTALLGGCASTPAGSAVSLDPGLTAADTTFAMLDPADEGARAAVPHVERRLRALGFEPSQNPDLLVEISAAERSRAIGAYVPGECETETVAWVEPPEENWLVGGGNVLTLNVRLIDAETGAPVFMSSAQRRADSGFTGAHAAKLTEAALRGDPRKAPRRATPGC